jgi:hypothetical protein
MKAIDTIKKLTIGMMILGAALVWPVVTSASEIDSVEIIDYGLYTTNFTSWQQAPKTQLGRIQLIGARELIRCTKRIPAKSGTEFGIRYVVNGQEEGSEVDLLVRVSHSESQTTNEWVASRQIGSPAFDGWKLGADSQITPGKLTIQLFHEGIKLAEKSFTVY